MGGINAFVYTSNNPIIDNDPYGLSPGVGEGAVIGGVIGGPPGAFVGTILGGVIVGGTIWVIVDWLFDGGEEEGPGDCEERDCKKIKDYFIDICSGIALPTKDFGWKFQRCVNGCLEEYGCL